MSDLVLETERLILRPVEDSDLDVAIEMFTDPEVMEFLGGETMSIAAVSEEMPTYTKRCAGGAIGIWCIVDNSNQEKLGSVFLLPLPIEKGDTDWDLVVGDQLPNAEIEIVYSLKKSAWGIGVATEAGRRLLQFAFEETTLDEVVAVIDEGNIASQKVLEKIGLLSQGHRYAYDAECPGFAITRQQWLEKKDW